MSASPARPPSGPNSVTPNTGGPPAPVARKKPAASIFHKKKPVRRPVQPGQRVAPPPASNGPPLHSYQQPMNGTARNNVPAAPAAAPATEPEEGTYSEFPIVISKRQLQEGLRFHAMKLQSRVEDQNPVPVNPYDESQFTRPLRLHRRYADDKMATAEQSDAASGVDDKERELMSARRAERQAEREENQKLIAPTGGDPSKQIKKKQQKKVEEGRDESNPAKQRRSKLRYEEARPWHLEDFEAKNVWIGSYEQPLSERSVMLEVKDDGTFGMVPVEKWYKFQQTNKVKVMDAEEANKAWAKSNYNPSRWSMQTHAKMDEAAREEWIKQQKRERMKKLQAKVKPEDDFDADRDMLDLDAGDLNEFQDDDEGQLLQIEDDDDAKEIERRIYLEMRDAGLGGTGVKNDDLDVEEDLKEQQFKSHEERKKQKKLRKQLRRREHQGQYSESDESDNPFGSSDSSDSDEEREEERKKEEAKKAAQLNGDKSGASTKGTNTPTGRPEKRDPSRLGASLKRPGSPDVSDLSGTESRKKVKNVNGKAVPARSPAHDAAGSDSDTSRKGLKLKLKNSPPGSRNGTPSGSRAASPALSPSAGVGFPTTEEVKAAIPLDGIDIKSLVQLFKSRVGDKTKDFIGMVKQAGRQSTDPAKKGIIIPK